MNIVYSEHAKEKIALKKFATIWIEETIKWPDFIKIKGHKYYAVRKLNGKTLKVVYEKQRYIKVITCYTIK